MSLISSGWQQEGLPAYVASRTLYFFSTVLPSLSFVLRQEKERQMSDGMVLKRMYGEGESSGKPANTGSPWPLRCPLNQRLYN